MLPPPDGISAPIVHEISALYAQVYRIGRGISKRDRYGILATLEQECIDALRLSIQSALGAKEAKLSLVRELSVQIEILKHLVRSAYDVSAIEQKIYIDLQRNLQTISKSATNWTSYLKRNEAR